MHIHFAGSPQQHAHWSWYGKLPGAGDFSVFNLRPAELDCLDDWLSHTLHAGQTKHAHAWHAAYMAMPMLGFALGPQCLGNTQGTGAHGVWMPSIDSAGRAFPLILFGWHSHEHPSPLRDVASATTLLSNLHQICAQALSEDWVFGRLEAALVHVNKATVCDDLPPGVSHWGCLQANGLLQHAVDCHGLPTLQNFEHWMGLEYPL
ncbi:MAG TPA: type VI secretion system-associated protein TagF [Limnobacter sp.]|nr:type VI secretion system-associated protein TagF [Limnobacter sp.]